MIPQMEELLKEIKNGLRAAGARKTSLRSEPSCIILESDFGDEVIIAVVFPTQEVNKYLVKIVPASRSVELLYGCEGVKYTPYGLYALISKDNAAEKVAAKARRVYEISRKLSRELI
jgi:hypothetical protein